MEDTQPMPGWRLALHYALSDGVPSRSLRVGLVIGALLNLINQGDVLFGDAEVNWLKMVLTFAMPYAVSTYGAVSFRMNLRRLELRVNASAPASPDPNLPGSADTSVRP
jgi:hypothetical protein